MKYLFLLIVIGASLGTFVAFINPRFDHISELRSDIAVYTDRLRTAEKIKESREQLISTYNSIQKTDLDNLKVLLPDSVDNIRLIIQLNTIALQNGLSTVRDVQYETPTETKAGTSPTDADVDEGNPVGDFEITFSTTGQYKNFLSFLSNMEQNLRLVDVVRVDFTQSATTTTGSSADNQQYKVMLKTYWLK